MSSSTTMTGTPKMTTRTSLREPQPHLLPGALALFQLRIGIRREWSRQLSNHTRWIRLGSMVETRFTPAADKIIGRNHLATSGRRRPRKRRHRLRNARGELPDGTRQTNPGTHPRTRRKPPKGETLHLKRVFAFHSRRQERNREKAPPYSGVGLLERDVRLPLDLRPVPDLPRRGPRRSPLLNQSTRSLPGKKPRKVPRLQGENLKRFHPTLDPRRKGRVSKVNHP